MLKIIKQYSSFCYLKFPYNHILDDSIYSFAFIVQHETSGFKHFSACDLLL